MKELLHLEDIHVSYDRHEVIRGVDLTVYEGEFCALLGLNGSGKTTILHAACGFLPMEGRCLVDGQDCSHMNEKKRARYLSLITQTPSLTGGKQVLDVVLMGFNARLKLLESPSKENRRAALDALTRLGLGDMWDRDFGTLSQGQKQLVILARCLMQDAPVMLMDEPDSALDFLNRHMVLGQIRDILHTEKRAGLITLHDPNFAMAYCDRICLLRDGVLQADINMRSAGKEEIRESLAKIYGEIELVEYAGGYLMGKRR